MIRRLAASMAAFAAISAPAFAQDGACGQPVALTQQLGQTIAPGFSDISEILRPKRSEPAYVEFEVTEPVDVTLETMGRGSDPVLVLFGAGGQIMDWDDDGAGNLDARVSASLQPGTYCTQMRAIAAEPVTDAMVVLIGYEGLPPDPADEKADAIAATCADPRRSPVLADALRPGEAPSAQGAIDPASSLGSFRLTLAEPATLQVDATSASFDTVLSIYDLNGARLWENDDHPDVEGSDSRIREPFEAGDYCVVVEPFSGTGGEFSIAVTAEGDEAQPE
ncbi:pre-peptidase C-terminal domain-containing protein [Falsirhodobacter deserti]|uniref:pre-peptidase C-terminal domain-containing protein n=1 Tax=Falsirhodobacter deserti TaxID=1365611 RepID=UPI000FE2F8CC|nr:pre-peptidase C-terminal domain-containing protein [Falsirhodobacter deserti]